MRKNTFLNYGSYLTPSHSFSWKSVQIFFSDTGQEYTMITVGLLVYLFLHVHT